MDQATIQRLARTLFDAEISSIPIDLLTAEFPSLQEHQAYQVAQACVEMRAQPIVGYKLGYTSAAMRVQMGIDRPNYGLLTKDRYIDPDLASAEIDTLIHPLVEPEIALLTKRAISGPDQTRHTVYGCIEAAFAAIEIVDTRFKEYKFKAADNTSDNSSAARFVLGFPHQPARLTDMRLLGAVLSSNGKVIDQGVGANVLGDPLNALAWLANKLSEHNACLPAGSIVLTGGLTKAHAAQKHQTFIAEICGLGSVKIHFN